MLQGELFSGKLEKKLKLPEDLRVSEKVHMLVSVTGAIQGRSFKEQFRFIFMEGLKHTIKSIGEGTIDLFMQALAPKRPSEVSSMPALAETPRIAPKSTGMPQNARKKAVS